MPKILPSVSSQYASQPMHAHSSLISAVRLPGLDMRELTERLSKNGMFFSYIGRDDALRFSFSPETSDEDIAEGVRRLRDGALKMLSS